ncbi:hypothetical protein C5167_000965 [Papaver somniferum]|uniref:Uncharacterized protein n=1 Tax=Papaver somniferum TaxID=3469 RepID=A0A4Y7KY00_PAPSO|nr:hypothetical protein C5167_000965 [Papaver somniferum]
MSSSVSMAQQEYGDLQLLMKLEDGMHTQPPRTWICPSVQVSTAGNLSVSDIKVKSELPSTCKALRYQQHRWSRGSANLFSKMVMDIIRNKRISLWRRVYVIYNLFLIWKMITPMCVMFPEVAIPKWGTVYAPTVISLLNTVETPRSIHLLAFCISLEIVMSITRTKAYLSVC